MYLGSMLKGIGIESEGENSPGRKTTWPEVFPCEYSIDCHRRIRAERVFEVGF